jgi:hypothetical protein
VVTRYRIALEQHPYAPSTINLRLAAIGGWRMKRPIADCSAQICAVLVWMAGRWDCSQ